MNRSATIPAARERSTCHDPIRFFRYVALRRSTALWRNVCSRCPTNGLYVRRPIAFLTSDEVAALLAAPDANRIGRRDQAMLLLAVQTGLRAAELTGLRCEDIILWSMPYVRCQGKGRKVRDTPLRKYTIAVLRDWLNERKGQPRCRLFPTLAGGSEP